MNAALGNLLARVAQGDLSPHEAKAIACSHWLSGNRDVAESLSAFAVELTKLRDEMQTDRYALSVASRSVEEIERILKSPHLDHATRARIKMFSFGKRHSNVGALVYTEAAAMKRGREIHERMAAHFRRQWPAIPDALFKAPVRPVFDLSAFHELGIKGTKPAPRARSGKRPKAGAARRKNSKATRRAKASRRSRR